MRYWILYREGLEKWCVCNVSIVVLFIASKEHLDNKQGSLVFYLGITRKKEQFVTI